MIAALMVTGLLATGAGVAPAPVSGSWAAGVASSSAGPGAAGLRAPMGDTVPALELTAAVAAALASHPRLAGAESRVGVAEAEAGAARSALLPSLAVSGVATRYEEPMVVAPLHGFDPARPPEFDETLYQGHATAEYTLFDGGGRRARIRGAEASAVAAAAGARSAREAVITEAVLSYLAALTARDVEYAHGARVEALESELARSRRFLEEGTAPRVSVLRTEAALSAARADREAARQRLRVALRRLERVTGLGDGLAGAQLVDVRVAGAGVESRDSLLSAAAATSAVVAEARARVEAAGAAVGAARSSFLPRVSLTGRYSAFAAASVDPALEWQAGVQLSYPLFTGGSRLRQVERASSWADAVRAEAELAERAVADAVDGALQAYLSSFARAEALEAAVAQSAEVVRIEALALSAGAGVQTDYLAAEAELLRARAALSEARHGMVEARVRLAQATGRLDLERVRELTEEVER
jgi:outer membrane protein